MVFKVMVWEVGPLGALRVELEPLLRGSLLCEDTVRKGTYAPGSGAPTGSDFGVSSLQTMQRSGVCSLEWCM